MIETYDVTICGIPELDGFCSHGMTHVLSILDPDIDDPAAFVRFVPHQRTILRFHDDVVPQADRVPPNEEHVSALIGLAEKLQADAGPAQRLLVHCHMGISRSTAAVAIILARRFPGYEERAFEKIRAIRSYSWPNSRMIAMADDLLGLGGTFSAALREHQRHVVKRHPEIADLVIRIGRENELPAVSR